VPGRIVVFGATGYTGRLTCEALVERGEKPVLAGRSESRLSALASSLGGDLETVTADVERPDTVRSLVERGDVLVATVGPFARFGQPAVDAAIAAGAWYLDSTGEPAFIRQTFERFGPAAESAGCGLVTAFGYDFVPGNLAGALALREAGEQAVRVDVGYYMLGDMRGGMSGGTQASLVGALLAPGFAYRGGRIVTERGAVRTRSFPVRDRQRAAISIGASEHFALPQVAPQLREVRAYLGWFDSLSRAMQVFSAVNTVMLKVPGVKPGVDFVTSRFVKGSTGGPDAAARAKTGSHAVGIAYDAAGRALSEVHLEGVNGYEFTGRILAWGASRALAEGLEGTGALGPVGAFGLDALERGASDAGISRVGAATPTAA
jgi:short subunit dehydrogenase-like uncharacterized protein